jgi:ATP-dependent Lon protease
MKKTSEDKTFHKNEFISALCQSQMAPPPVLILATSGEQTLGKRKRKEKNNNEPEAFENTLSNDEFEYFQSLDNNARTHFIQIHNEMMLKNVSHVPYRFKIMGKNIHPNTMKIAMKKINMLAQMADGHRDGEYHKLNNWVSKLCDVPLGEYISMNVNKHSARKEINEFLQNTKGLLDANVYGHSEAKDNIVRIVAQWISNPQSKGNVIGIHGNPGVGKTTLIKDGVCKAIGLPFAFIPLGGASDSSYLDGHSYTYEGSTCGRIVDVLIQTGCMNPVIYFDELDKVSDTYRGKEIINVLIHLTDPAQNDHFSDKYFTDIKFDLSKCLIVFTYNNPHFIDPILKDRMITIHTKDYTIQDKIAICKSHLLPSILDQFAMKMTDVQIPDDSILHLIDRIAPEAGVRNLKRALECIVSNINLEKLTSEKFNENEVLIDTKLIDKFVSPQMEGEFSAKHIYM